MVKSSGPPPSCCGRLSPLLVARADEAFDRRCSLLHCVGPLLALSDASRQRSTSVAFGAKRTLTEPRLQKADLRSTLVQGRIGIALGIDGTRAVQLSTSSRELHAQFGQPDPPASSGWRSIRRGTGGW